MGLYKRKGSEFWYYKFTINGRTVRESTGTERKADAAQAEAHRRRELWEQAKLGVKAPRRWTEAVVSYLQTLPEGRNKEQTIKELVWFDAHLRPLRLEKIDTAFLEELRSKRAAAVVARADAALARGHKPRATTPAPATMNRVMGVVMSVLHHAVKLQWLPAAPALVQLPVPKKGKRFLSRPEALSLIQQLPRHQRLMVIFALETGLRRSNVTQLRWSQVGLEQRIVWVNPENAKENEGIAVPLSPLACAVLEQQPKAGDFVFTYRGKPVYQTSTKAWRAAQTRAGLSGVKWHHLRHTWASWHRQGGTPTHALQELGAWKDPRMPENYAHLNADHLQGYVHGYKGLGADLGTLLEKQDSSNVGK